jgi:hypothetical protein
VLYHLAYKSLPENLQWREWLADRCSKDKQLAAAIRETCKHDFLFWINFACWTHDPRLPNPVVPFVTWDFQDEALRTMEASLGKEDVCVVKSRDMGASWMIMALFTHRWQFWNNLAFGAVSREEKLVDGHPKSLFAKVDFLLERQPGFLLPRFEHLHLRFRNLDTGSTLEGSTTTGNVFRGDRYTAVMMDEFAAFEEADGNKALASSQSATNSRFFNSTPQGAIGAFYEVAHNKHIRRIDLHWSKHPEKARGIKRGYDGKLWSPWYERECQRMPIPAMIAQELDLDFAGSASPFFPPDVIDKVMAQQVRPPVGRGRLDFDPLAPLDREKHKFLEEPAGDLLLWLLLADGRPPQDEEYVVGCDVSQGTGATNSVLSVASRRTREKVAEFASANLSPDKLADLALALAAWFNGAFIIWEMNGPGGAFGKRIMDQGYRNVYYRQDEQSLEHKVAKSLTPGWHASPQNKLLLFREYVRALGNGFFVNRSSAAVQECRQYVYLPNGQIGNARAQAFADPSGARQNHGDRPTADALANRALGAEPALKREPDPLAIPVDPPWGSLAWRRQKAEQEKKLQVSGHWESSRESLHGWNESPVAGVGW